MTWWKYGLEEPISVQKWCNGLTLCKLRVQTKALQHRVYSSWRNNPTICVEVLRASFLYYLYNQGRIEGYLQGFADRDNPMTPHHVEQNLKHIYTYFHLDPNTWCIDPLLTSFGGSINNLKKVELEKKNFCLKFLSPIKIYFEFKTAFKERCWRV